MHISRLGVGFRAPVDSARIARSARSAIGVGLRGALTAWRGAGACRFQDGYLVKSVSIQSCQVEESPTFDELQRFHATGNDDEGGDSTTVVSANTQDPRALELPVARARAVPHRLTDSYRWVPMELWGGEHRCTCATILPSTSRISLA